MTAVSITRSMKVRRSGRWASTRMAASASDPRSELLVKGDSASPVANIAFDRQGRMLLAQRGAQKGAYDYGAFVDAAPTQVLRYALENPDNPATPGIWSPMPDSYAAGYAAGSKSASGGLTLQYAYRSDGTLDASACQGTVALTADGTEERKGSRRPAQRGRSRPACEPPAETERLPRLSQQAGICRPHGACRRREIQSTLCRGGGGFPPVAGAGGGFPPVAGGALPPLDGGGFPPVAGFPGRRRQHSFPTGRGRRRRISTGRRRWRHDLPAGRGRRRHPG